jgi:hypothetical protein
MKHIITIVNKAGSFAQNKDTARDIRTEEIVPSLEKGEEVILDFQNVNSATQSFIHALISEVLRKYGDNVLDRIRFKSCNEEIQQIIKIVVDYMVEGIRAG